MISPANQRRFPITFMQENQKSENKKEDKSEYKTEAHKVEPRIEKDPSPKTPAKNDEDQIVNAIINQELDTCFSLIK